MGCCLGQGPQRQVLETPPESDTTALRWDQRVVLAQGSNKSVFSGTFKGAEVVVCHARDTNEIDIQRARNEIEMLQTLGKHSAIICMHTFGEQDEKPFLVLERVEPIGFDLGRLWSQYELLGQKVPSLLCGRLYRQMAEGLQHMHKNSILHLDLKTQNVLVTWDYNAKLCDLGISCQFPARCQLVAGYMSPELCEGKKPLGPPADCWGLGLILHQMYQHGEWNLVECQTREEGKVKAKLRDGMPSNRSMPKEVRAVMQALLKEDPSERMAVKGLLDSEWLSKKGKAHKFERPQGNEWFKIPKAPPEPSKWLAPYQGSSRPLTLLVLVGSKQSHLFDKTLGDLGLGMDFPDPEKPVITLLVRQPGAKGRMIRQPGEETKLEAGTRLYIGVPGDSVYSQDALESVREMFDDEHDPSPERKASERERISNSGNVKKDLIIENGLHEGEFRSKREVAETGVMYSFAMEFDCFVFPKHIGDEATIGKLPMVGPAGQFAEVKHIALNLRNNFAINLAGIQRVSETEVEWFPDEFAQVRPGDLGLIARCPWEDGSTDPSVNSDDLAKIMIEEKFKSIIENDYDTRAAEEGVAMNKSGKLGVLLYTKPAEISSLEKSGEIPNNTKVKVIDRYGDFLLVESAAGNGWAGTKNIQAE